jgi:hypothetical protein
MSDEDTFATGLSHEDELPLLWEPLADAPQAERCRQLDEANLQALHALASLEEQRRAELDDHDPLSAEIHRLDAKLTLVIRMLGRLLQRDAVIPDPVPLSLRARGIEWVAAGQPPGSWGLVHLYPNRDLPFGLVLPARLEETAAPEHPGRVRAVFSGVGQLVEDEIAKLIFRHHRRAIAETRQRAP